MELKFTEHPIVKPPTDEEILFLAQNEPKILAELHAAHEGRIRGAEEDPLRHGFDLDGWQRMRRGLNDYNECLVLGGNRSGKTTGCAKMVMQAVTENTDGHVVCFSQNADTSVKVQQAALLYAKWIYWAVIYFSGHQNACGLQDLHTVQQ